MQTIIENIKGLVNIRDSVAAPLRGEHLAELPVLENAFLLIEDDRIADYGLQAELHGKQTISNRIDAAGGYVLPAWCDSHTHLVFPNSREGEFTDKIKGLSYAEIAARGGGILSSAKQLEQLSEDQLFNDAKDRLHEIARLGTGAVEIKSGYGLSLEGELKMLRVIKRLRQQSELLIKATFLGAHAFPPEYANRKDDYVKLIIDEMLPAIAAEKLADYIDVFCETGFFTPEQTLKIGRAGKDYGLRTKLHANQLNLSGGVQAGVSLDALSVDHLETMNQESIDCLANSGTMGTILPAAAFFLRMAPAPVRAMIDAGVALAIASDFNPGSAPTGNMNLVLALACIQSRLLPEEAINAATIQGAFAMDLQNEAGSITVGKKANLIITKEIPSLAYLPYAFGTNLVREVLIAGRPLT